MIQPFPNGFKPLHCQVGILDSLHLNHVETLGGILIAQPEPVLKRYYLSMNDVVLGSPVSRLEKNRTKTGTGPIRTGNSQDRKRPRPRSGLRSFRIWEFRGPVNTG